MTEPVFKVSRALIEAYRGFYEKEVAHLDSAEAEIEIARLIVTHEPKERLAVYLMWNGIIGYTETIYSIAIGRLA